MSIRTSVEKRNDQLFLRNGFKTHGKYNFGSLYNEIAHLKNWIKIVHCDTFVLRLSCYTKTN